MKINIFSKFFLRFFLSLVFFNFLLLIYRRFKFQIDVIDIVILKYVTLAALVLYLISDYKKVVKVISYFFAFLKSNIFEVKKPIHNNNKAIVIKMLDLYLNEKKKKLILIFLLPLFFFLLCIKLTLWSLYFQGDPFNILTQNLNKYEYIGENDGEIFAKEKIVGEFEAMENNLGIISFMFNTFDRPNTDYLEFRLKEKEGDWFYRNEYQSAGFPNHLYLPFGFPKITNSMGKTYTFELTSISGKQGNAVSLDKKNPVIQIKYVFDIKNLLAKPFDFINFVYRKIVYLIINSNFLFNLMIYCLPLFLYLLFFILNLKQGIVKAVSMTAIFLFILIDTFLLKNNDINYLTLILIWLFLSIKLKLSGRLSVLFGLVFLFSCPFFLLKSNEVYAEKVSIWAYLFIIAGTILIMLEERRLHGKQNNN